MEETHPSFLRTSTDLLIPVSKIISRPIGVGTSKGLLVSPSIGYNHGIFVCSHHFIYCWLKAIHFYRSYLSSGFRARCEMELEYSSRYPYGDFLSIVEFFQTSTSMAVCFYGHSSAFSWSPLRYVQVVGSQRCTQ